MKIETKTELIKSIMEYAMILHRNTEACVFVTFSGHTDVLEVIIYSDGNCRGTPKVKETIDIKAGWSLSKLEYFRDYLKKLWLEWNDSEVN